MAAVCDVYDAITSNRAYKQAWDPSAALGKMADWVDGHFDKSIFQAFVKCLGIYPIGSLVRLSSGVIGVVVDQTAKSLTTPIVKVFYSLDEQRRIEPYLIDLSQERGTQKISGREDPYQWNFTDLNALWTGLPSITF
jgi:hypothetical protein